MLCQDVFPPRIQWQLGHVLPVHFPDHRQSNLEVIKGPGADGQGIEHLGRNDVGESPTKWQKWNQKVLPK